MEFRNLGRPFSEDGMSRTCDALGVDGPAVWAILTVETAGFGFFEDRRPRILFERHFFHRLTKGRFDAGNPDISSKTPGGYLVGTREYSRLEKALALDEDAALKSASWGVGQVMGANHLVAGFASVQAMVGEMVRDENAQLLAVAKFIKGNRFDGALRRGDWTAFARGYNGPGFKKNQYDLRLAAAHAKYLTLEPNLKLRTAQAALSYLGLAPGAIDGLQGRFTRAALIAFQTREGLATSGNLDRITESKLLAAVFPTSASTSAVPAS